MSLPADLSPPACLPARPAGCLPVCLPFIPVCLPVRLQDKFNDGGWGCAYRSLQTIISWFRLQHYTSKPVPGHRQIQEILVSTGDKDASLIGSSQWLGSFELSYILDAYLGITCKVREVTIELIYSFVLSCFTVCSELLNSLFMLVAVEYNLFRPGTARDSQESIVTPCGGGVTWTPTWVRSHFFWYFGKFMLVAVVE